MTLAANVTYRDGFYWKSDGSGPYTRDGADNLILATPGMLPVAVAGAVGAAAQLFYEVLPPAYFVSYNRTGAGHIWQKKLVTSTATGLDVASGPALFGGLILVSATGVIAQVYDGRTATGDPLVLPALAASYQPQGGIICTLGITVDWTSGSWLVLYAPVTGS